jgi:glycine cleavage system H protein
MTVLLVLATFLVFILVDVILSRRKAKVTEPAVEPVTASMEPEPGWVEGFRTPEHLQYHPGHSWLLRERRNVVRVGVDDFAAALLSSPEAVELPKPGHWIRQGQKAWSFSRRGEKTEMVSPIEGEVVEINEAVMKDPALLRRDPYGEGWLMTVFVPDEESTGRNLLPAELVPGWMRSAIEHLYSLQPQVAGAVAADGGLPVSDLVSGLAGRSWKEVTQEFFLTK